MSLYSFVIHPFDYKKFKEKFQPTVPSESLVCINLSWNGQQFKIQRWTNEVHTGDLCGFKILLNHITAFHISATKYLLSLVSYIIGFTNLSSLHRQRISRAFISPMSRLKEVMIGSGGRGGSFTRGSASMQY